MNSSRSSSGVGITTVTFIVFLVLKLTGLIDWSWWWVTSPLWISALAAIALVPLAVVIGAWSDPPRRRRSSPSRGWRQS